MKIANMTETSPDVIKDVEAVMRQKLAMVASQDYAAAGGVKGLADLLNSADRGTERNVIDTLAERDAQLAEEIRMLLFVFEDIIKLDDRSVQLVLKDVDQKDLAMALRGVSEEVKREDPHEHVAARRGDAGRGDRVPATAAAQRGRGGAGAHRGVHSPSRGRRGDHHRARRRRGDARTLSSVAAEADAFSFDQLPPEPAGARASVAPRDAESIAEEALARARAEADDVRHQARQDGHRRATPPGMEPRARSSSRPPPRSPRRWSPCRRAAPSWPSRWRSALWSSRCRSPRRWWPARWTCSRSAWWTWCAARCAAWWTASA